MSYLGLAQVPESLQPCLLDPEAQPRLELAYLQMFLDARFADRLQMVQVEEGQRALPLQLDERLLSHDAHHRLSGDRVHVYHASEERMVK